MFHFSSYRSQETLALVFIIHVILSLGCYLFKIDGPFFTMLWIFIGIDVVLYILLRGITQYYRKKKLK